jgi:hypothetical protein
VTADVAVKRASKKFVIDPDFEAIGNISRNVPSKIMAVKAVAIS